MFAISLAATGWCANEMIALNRKKFCDDGFDRFGIKPNHKERDNIDEAIDLWLSFAICNGHAFMSKW